MAGGAVLSRALVAGSRSAAFVAGCSSLLGRRGIAVGAVVTVLVANPPSAAAIPRQFLATPWGAIGQHWVPGAANSLIRSLSYFPDADTTRQWLVLQGWVLLGIVLVVAGHHRARSAVRLSSAPSSTPPAAAHVAA